MREGVLARLVVHVVGAVRTGDALRPLNERGVEDGWRVCTEGMFAKRYAPVAQKGRRKGVV